MYKSQLEPPSENFHETQVFVENIFDTVKKAREAKAARSLAESKLASYDYSFDFSPSKRKRAKKNAKNKKSVKNAKTTPKKKPRKNSKTLKDGSSEKKKKTTPTKTPRKYTKRAKVKPANDIDDEEAAFILSSISQRSFDSFYNRFNGNSIQIPLESPQTSPSAFKPPQPAPVSTQNCAYHVLLDHNYWIAEPEIIKPPEPKPDAMNLLSTVAQSILHPVQVEPTTSTAKPLEVNNNKLPLLDVSCDTPKCDNAVKKRWLRQATSENTSPVLAVTPPEMSPDDLKAPLKKRRMAREIDEYWADQKHKDEIKKCETESDQKVLNLVKNNVKEIDEVAVDLSNVNRVVRSSIIVDGRNYSNGFCLNKVEEKKFEPRALNFDASSSILAQSLSTLPAKPSILPPPTSYDPKASFFGLIPTAYNPTQIDFEKFIKFEEKNQLADQHINIENAQLQKEFVNKVLASNPSPVHQPLINHPIIEMSQVNHVVKSPTKVKQNAKKKEKKVKQVKPKKPKKVKPMKVKKPPKVKQPKISKAKQKKAEKEQNEKLKNILKSQEVKDLLIEASELVANDVTNCFKSDESNFIKEIKNAELKADVENVKCEDIKNEVLTIIKPTIEEAKIEDCYVKKIEIKTEKIEEDSVEEKNENLTPETKVEKNLNQINFETKVDEIYETKTIENSNENSEIKVDEISTKVDENFKMKVEEILQEKIERIDEVRESETGNCSMKIEDESLDVVNSDETQNFSSYSESLQKFEHTTETQPSFEITVSKSPTPEKYIPEKVTDEDEYSLDSIKSFDSIELKTIEEPSKPSDPVVSQVASILEKVIPKILKPEIEPPNELIEDEEDDSQHWECVEEFHKNSLEKLMLANRRFCNNIIQNPFKAENEPQRHSRFDKPFKSLSFDSNQPLQCQPHFQRSVSEVFNEPRKDQWSNGFYERRDSYGSFHYDKIHHREQMTTTYSMYRAQKAAQVDHRWNNNNAVWQPQPDPPNILNNFTPVTPTIPQPIPRIVAPEIIRTLPVVIAEVQAPATPVEVPDPFCGFLKELTPCTPKAKTSSCDPRLNPSLAVELKKDEPSTPKKKLSLEQYRKRQSLTSISSQPEDSSSSPPQSSISSPTSSLPPAFDPSIAAAAATG